MQERVTEREPLGDSCSPQGPVQDWEQENSPGPRAPPPQFYTEAESHLDVLQGQFLSLQALGPKAVQYRCHGSNRGCSGSG